MNQQSTVISGDLIYAIERIWQGVIQLELNFESYGLADGLGLKQRKKLAAWLDVTKSRLALMKSALEAESGLDELLEELGLPPFSSDSPEACQMLFQMIDERQAACHRSVRFLAEQLGPLRLAARNKLSFSRLWYSRRLAKQTRILEQGRSELEHDQNALEQNVRHALRYVQGMKTPSTNKKANVDDILQSFHQAVQAMCSQFQAMQKRCFEEHRQVHYMKTWLQDARAALGRPRQVQSPKLKELSALNQSWDLYGLSHYLDAQKRLTIAREYVQLQLKRLRHIQDENPWLESNSSTRLENLKDEL